MEDIEFAEYIATAITNRSRYYHAHVSDKPRLYLSLAGDRKVANLRHVIVIERYEDIYWINHKVFIFLSDIFKYIRKQSRSDSDFASRVHTMSLSADDIEQMIYLASRQRIKLWMKGRKSFFYNDIDDD